MLVIVVNSESSAPNSELRSNAIQCTKAMSYYTMRIANVPMRFELAVATDSRSQFKRSNTIHTQCSNAKNHFTMRTASVPMRTELPVAIKVDNRSDLTTQ